jgi:hypothetical protein
MVKRLQFIAEVRNGSSSLQKFANALDRKRSDHKLCESEERLSLAARYAGAGLRTLDTGTGPVWATENYLLCCSQEVSQTRRGERCLEGRSGSH